MLTIPQLYIIIHLGFLTFLISTAIILIIYAYKAYKQHTRGYR